MDDLQHAVLALGGHSAPRVGVREVVEVVVGDHADHGLVHSEEKIPHKCLVPSYEGFLKNHTLDHSDR